MSAARRQRGFALVAAIFLLVVLAAGALVLVRVVAAQQGTVALSLQQARAYHAARSGIAWATARVFDLGDCPPATTLSLTEGGLTGFDVDVTCTATQHVEAGETIPVYRLEAVSRYGVPGAPGHVRRRIGATVVDDA